MFLLFQRKNSRNDVQNISRNLSPQKPKILKGLSVHDDLPNVTVGEWVLAQLKKHYDHTIMINCQTEQQFTGADIYRCSINLSSALIDKYNLSIGDSVCFYAPTQPNYIIGVIGVWTAGGVFTGCDPQFPESELYNVIEDTKAQFIVTSRENHSKAQSVAKQFGDQIKGIIIIEELEKYFDYRNDVLEHYYDNSNEQCNLPVTINELSSEMSAVMFTSGTTGRPKPVIRSHSDLIYVSCEMQHKDLLSLNYNDCAAFNVPIFHSGGLYYLLHFLVAGCTMAVFSGYHQQTFLSYTEKYKISIAFLLYSHLIKLIKSDELNNYDLKSLNEVFYEGANLPDGVATEAKNKLGLKYIRQAAGQSEIGFVALCPRSMNDPESKSVGRPAPGLEIKIVDNVTDHTLPAYKIGEIRIKSLHATRGYLNRPEMLTQQLFDSEGYVKTGDAGYYDDNGFLYIVDRLRWIITVNRKVIVPSELEQILRSHPMIAEAAVVPVENEKYGQIPRAFVTIKKEIDCQIDENQIIEYVAQRVDAYKQLRGGVMIIPEMPVSPNGRGRIRKALLLNM